MDKTKCSVGSNTIVPPVANAEPVYKLPEELKVWIVLPPDVVTVPPYAFCVVPE
jgi:hypothetical protein